MPSKLKPKRLTVRFSKRLKAEVQSSLIEAGYGLHGKSRWLNETIAYFLQQPHFLDYVENGTNVNQAELSEIESFYLDNQMNRTVKAALMTIRKKHPLLEGVQSALIRAAIVYRLMLTPQNSKHLSEANAHFFPGKKFR